MSDLPEIQGFVESCARGDGFIVVSGWATTAKGDALDRLALYVEGPATALITQFNYREDLDQAGLAGGKAAFSLTVQTGKTTPKRPSIFGLGGQGLVPLSSESTRYRTFVPRGAIERVDAGQITGWVFDPYMPPQGDPHLLLRLDGQVELPLALSIPRPDVIRDCGVSGQTVGFGIETPLAEMLLKVAPPRTILVELVSRGIILDTVSVSSPILDMEIGSPRFSSEPLKSSKTASASLNILLRVDARNGIKGSVVYEGSPTPSLDNLAVCVLGHRIAVEPCAGPDASTGGRGDATRLRFAIPAMQVLNALRASGSSHFDANTLFDVALMKSPTTLALARGALLTPHQGNFESLSGSQARGWLAGDPDMLASFDVAVNDVYYATFTADRPRQDLIDHGLAWYGGGFEFDVANPDPDRDRIKVSVYPAYQSGAIFGSPRDTELPAATKRQNSAYSVLCSATNRPISIVIPIHNAADDLELCLASLRKWTSMPHRVIAINDASTDPRVGQVLEAYSQQPEFEVYSNSENLGFTRTANRGIVLAGEDDVVLLNSDTVVTPRWLQGLRLAAYSEPRVATVTPVSNNAGVFSVPEMNVANVIPQSLGIVGMARLVSQCGLGRYPRVPTGNGYCLFIRRNCIDAIGLFDEEAFPVGYGEENDFCLRALHAGFENILDDRTYIYHKRSASFGAARSHHYDRGQEVLRARYPEYQRLGNTFASPEVTGVRWRIRRAMEKARSPRPRVLFVISTETGGTPQTNRDLMLALESNYEPWLLISDSRQLRLLKVGAAGDSLIEKRMLATPIEPLTHRSEAYDAAVFDLISHYGFELVHARHLAWHGLGLQDVCRLLAVPFVLSLHDYYTLCPSTKLLDSNLVYCGGVCSQADADCAVELWEQRQFPPLKNAFVHRWRAKFGAVLEACDALVTTSQGAKETFLSHYPALGKRKFHVIPHGRGVIGAGSWCDAGAPGEPLRILVAGNISAAKGANLIAAICDLDRGARLEFHIMGDPGILTPRPGLVVYGPYGRDEFVGRARKIRPNIGVIFSIWPETYCHTLTEMWALGLPVVGLDIGAVGERLRQHGCGWLLPHRCTSADIMAFLHHLHAERSEISRKITRTREWQETDARAYGTAEMGSRYSELYLEILSGGLAGSEYPRLNGPQI